MTKIATLLKKSYPADVVDALLAAYAEIESNYALRKWKASELDAGHFVEAARRLLEHTLFGGHTPIGQSLSNFNDLEQKKYETGSGDEAFRILVPRVLRSVYGVRNKRGVGHVGLVSPNEMDATLILYSTKWVLAEFVRQASGLSPAATQAMVDGVVERRLMVLWKHDGLTRVLESSLDSKKKTLVLLYDADAQSDETLRASIEYKNLSNFRALLRQLHKKRLIEYRSDRVCQITPKGVVEAEAVLRNLSP